MIFIAVAGSWRDGKLVESYTQFNNLAAMQKNSRAYEPASHSWHLPNSSCSAPSPEAFHGLLGLSLHFLLVGNAVCNSLSPQDARRSSLTECWRTDRLLRELQSKDRDLWSSFVTVDDGVSVVDSPSDIPRPRCRETSDVLGRRPSGVPHCRNHDLRCANRKVEAQQSCCGRLIIFQAIA